MSSAVESERGSIIAGFLRVFTYRFFILATALPYLLGSVFAYHRTGFLDARLFLIGLAGILGVGLGIEGMNEYFDSRIGGDRVFASAQRQGKPWHLPLGIGGFLLGLLAALFLAHARGVGILVFAVAGGAAAFSYLAPPLRLSYRGFGELVIGLSYGPGVTVGAYYLQTGRVDGRCVLLSLLPGLLMFATALVNEVPDYYGDRLVGKRNLIVRLGRRRGVQLYGAVLAVTFLLILVGCALSVFGPLLALSALPAPLAFLNVRRGLKSHDVAVEFLPVVCNTLILDVLTLALAIVAFGAA